MRRSREFTVSGVLALVVGCAAPAAAPTLPDGAVPEVVGEARTLDADGVAADAIDREALVELLEGWGFRAATERSGSDRPGGLDRVIVRAVRFGGPEGAEAYLTWYRGHVDEVLGASERIGEIDAPSPAGPAPLFRHSPDDCCPKDTIAYLTAWRDGDTVITLEMAGADVDEVVVSTAAQTIRVSGS